MNNFFFVTMFTFMFTGVTHAAALKISPVSVELAQSQQSSSLTIANDSSEQTNLQIRVFKWQQEGTEELYIPTNDVVVSPPALSLKEQQSYNLRVVRALLHKGLKDRAPLEDPNLSYNSGLRSA